MSHACIVYESAVCKCTIIRVLFINILFINMSSMPSIRLLFMNTNNINLAINQQLSESNRAYNLSKQINAVNNALASKAG